MPRITHRRHASPLRPWLVLVGLILFCRFPASGSDRVLFKTWNTENGLPQNTVNSIVQTPDGYLWCATFDGLARFDGAQFKIFRTSNTPELPTNRMYQLRVDAAGRLWIWTEDRNTLVLYEQGKFRAFVKGVDFNSDNLHEIVIEGGELRLRSGSDQYVFTQGKFERRPGEQNDKVVRVFLDTVSRIVWLNTGSGYYAVSENKSTFYQKDAAVLPDRTKLQLLTSLETNGAFWFFAPEKNGYRLCALRNGQVAFSSVTSPSYKLLRQDLAGNLWIVDFYEGVRKVAATNLTPDDPTRMQAEHFSKANGLASNNVFELLVDRDGNIWIGSDKGLQLLIDEPIVTVYSRKNGLPAENVYAMVQNRAGAIWFGDWTAHLVRYAEGKFTPEPLIFVQALFVDRDSRLWVSSLGKVFYRNHDHDPWSALDDELKPAAAERVDVYVISQDREGNMWFGGTPGIVRYQGGQARTFSPAEGLPGSDVTAFLQTSSGTIWVGTTTGIAHLEGERFVPLSGPNGPLKMFVRSLYEDGEGTLWVGTYDGGLMRYKNGAIRKINSSSGLFNDGVFCILEDDDGWFWMNSNQGIYRVQRDELNRFADGQVAGVNSVSYGPDDGLLNVEGNGGKQPAGLKALDGTLWFPTAGGVAVIDPRKARRDLRPLPVLIEDVTVDRDEIDSQSGVIRVEPGQSTIDIAYTALSFVGANHVRFRYRLEGLDQDWTEAGSRRAAYFSHLPYGDYTFRVIAANQEGVWSPTGATIRLLVVAPFYRRGWFYAVVTAGLFLLAASFYVYRVRRLHAINEARADYTRRLIDTQEKERRRIALELHDSLGQSLAVIRNRALMSLTTPDELDTMREQMQEISEASALALLETREIAHNLHPAQIEHLGLPEALANLVESVSSGTAIEFEANIADSIAPISPDEAINLYRIVQESLSNLVKHAHASHATVALYEADGRLIVRIEDDGGGIPAGTTAGGLGLKGMRERAEIIKAELQIESGAGKGTLITVSLPRNSTNHG